MRRTQEPGNPGSPPRPPKGGVLRARAITESRKESGFALKKKTTIITARLTPSEKAAIQKRARKAKMTMTDYIIQYALGKEIVQVDGLGEILSEIKAQGRNINQLATLANMGRLSVVQSEDLIVAYSKLCSQLEKIAGEVNS
ncbi:plasmid mobilization protein [Acutalibacter muris]